MYSKYTTFRQSKAQSATRIFRRLLSSSSARMNVDVSRIITFWFSRPPMEWIIAPEGLDDQIKSGFSDLITQARRNDLDGWAMESDAESSLALVVLLDQFSRNYFRGSAEAFSADEKAWNTATRAIARGLDKKVTIIQASAFYMPLMHRESLISLIAARGLFEGLKSRCHSKEEHDWVDIGISASQRHLQQLKSFGRFPTRNALLGRKNTVAEEKFLEEHKQSL